MSIYSARARTNYFLVKDAVAFLAAVRDYPVTAVASPDGGHCLVSSTEHGDWPWSGCDEETGDDFSIDWGVLLAEHLTDGQVAVLMEAGGEASIGGGCRSVFGSAIAWHSSGAQVSISLDSIYEQAAQAFAAKGLHVAPITNCHY